MSGTDKRKHNVHFSPAILEEIERAATRLDRSLSWIVQKAWKLARGEIMRVSSVGGKNARAQDVPQARENDGG